MLLLMRYKVLANPAAKIVHPVIVSLMNMESIGEMSQNHVRIAISESIRYLIVRFIDERK